MRDTRYGIGDTGYRIHDTGCRIRDTGYGIQDAGYKLKRPANYEEAVFPERKGRFFVLIVF